MTVTTILLSFSALAVLSLGLYLLLSPAGARGLNRRWLQGGVSLNILLFAGGMAGLLFAGVSEVMAATETVESGNDISLGLGLALIGVGLPTALATIGAGIAVSSVGSASLAVIAEKPELTGRVILLVAIPETLVILGFAVAAMIIILLGG